VKAVRLHKYDERPIVEEIPDPKIEDPWDVIVRIGGAGLCRTDLHVVEGQWAAKTDVQLPYTLGHENAGWVQEVGSAVTNVAPGDTVILHPLVTCGLCRACRAGDDVHCDLSRFPGIDADGGMGGLLKTGARACVKLDPSLRPADVAALADAGLTAYHAVRKAVPLLYPGTKVAVIGAGGLGHIGVQSLQALTAAEIIVVDRSEAALELARSFGADHTVLADGSQVERVKELTDGKGAEVVLDFVETGRPGAGLGDDPPRRVALRGRLRRDDQHPHHRCDLHRAQRHRKPGRQLQRPGRADGAGRPRQGEAAHPHLPARRGQRRHGRPGRRPPAGARHPRPVAASAFADAWRAIRSRSTGRGGPMPAVTTYGRRRSRWRRSARVSSTSAAARELPHIGRDPSLPLDRRALPHS